MHFSVYLIFVLIFGKESLGKKQYDFKLLYKWKQIEYKFNSEEERSEAIANGTFKVGKVEPLDVQYAYDCIKKTERIFITTPRFRGINPATIGIITNETRDGNPVIAPYPSWSWHLNPEQCNYYSMISVFRVWLDECDRLWVIDSGRVGSNYSCPPQLLTFDLKTDKLLYKYVIPFEQHQNNSLYVTPVGEVISKKNECKNTWVYVASPQKPSLLVYSLKKNSSWRVEDDTFKPDLNYENFTVAGVTIQDGDGLMTLALTPASDGPRRKLLYHALASITESWVYTKALKNSTNFKIPTGSPQFFHTFKHKRNQQAPVETTDREGNLYFSLVADIEIAKWNTRTVYKQENFEIIADDKETMQFPSGLKVTPYKGGPQEALWTFATVFQKFFTGTLNGNETNFRLFVTIL